MSFFKTILFLIVLSFANQSISQVCTQDDRFTNAQYFAKTQIDSVMNVTYATASNYKGESQDLQMDIYFPNKDKDPMAERPFILLIHGGGFRGGRRDGSIKKFCDLFAQRGFVVATMSYRLGFKEDNPAGRPMAVYRAQQDANAALRYMVANKDQYKVNANWIFIGGSSAGAITSLFTAYGQQEEWNQAMPQAETLMGSIQNSGNDLQESFTIRGIFNHMGAAHQLVFMNEQNFVPMVSFHGELDNTVPIDENPMSGLGSRAMHKRLDQAGVCNDFTMVPGGGHDIYYSQEGFEFRADRVSCFFKSLMCESCTSYTAAETVASSCAE